MAILIITNKLDLPSDDIIHRLLKRGEKVFRFNTEDLCTEFNLRLSINNNSFDGSLYSSLRSVNFSEIKSILYRRPKKVEVVNQDDASKDFIEAEIAAFINWLWKSLDCFWISAPSNIRMAESKIDQLRIAPTLGFKIPETIITNNPDDVVNFYKEHNSNIINKALAKGMIEQDGKMMGIYTRRVEESHLEFLDSIRFLPCLFQERIEKKYELRITVVGRQIFASEIHSQNSQRTKDDWRRYDIENTPHKIHELPVKIKKSCLGLVEHYGLSFGAIDMIVTPQNEYVFLEINPNGQWLWIEHLTNLPISEAITNLLIKGKL